MEIKVENLTKQFGAQKAIDHINFDLHKGEVLGFLGPNGAGKSSTMKIITCFMAPSSGDVKVDGQSIFNDPGQFKQRIGYLPEHTPLYSDMFIIDYLNFVAKLQAVPQNKVKQRIGQMIEYCGLDAEKHKKIGELSKGYQQRVGLAQAMIHDPEVLILDEPTTGLDPNQIVEIRELIKNLGEEKTIILSTHILPEVEVTSDRIVIVNDGQIVADNKTEELRKQAQGNELLRVQVEPNGQPVQDISKALQNIDSVENVEVLDDQQFLYQIQSKSGVSSKKPVFQLCVDKGWYMLELSELETRLEDIFRELTQ